MYPFSLVDITQRTLRVTLASVGADWSNGKVEFYVT